MRDENFKNIAVMRGHNCTTKRKENVFSKNTFIARPFENRHIAAKFYSRFNMGSYRKVMYLFALNILKTIQTTFSTLLVQIWALFIIFCYFKKLFHFALKIIEISLCTRHRRGQGSSPVQAGPIFFRHFFRYCSSSIT